MNPLNRKRNRERVAQELALLPRLDCSSFLTVPPTAGRSPVPEVWPPLSSWSSFRPRPLSHPSTISRPPTPPRIWIRDSSTLRCGPTLLSPLVGHLHPGFLPELSPLCPSPPCLQTSDCCWCPRSWPSRSQGISLSPPSRTHSALWHVRGRWGSDIPLKTLLVASGRKFLLEPL